MTKRRRVGNLTALAVLGLLAAGVPMHPYQMASVLRRTGKDRDMRIKWGSFYTVVANLEKHGLIVATGSDRSGRRPERTTYGITDAGRAELQDWVRELVGVPEPDTSRFEAALSVLGALSPDEATALLEQRVRALDESIAADREALAQSREHVVRVFLVEAEYALAMREAEARWIRGLLEDLTDGAVSGVEAWREYHMTGRPAADWAEFLAEGDTFTSQPRT
jgi:DNA-binding PadR family transcriptional regulator